MRSRVNKTGRSYRLKRGDTIRPQQFDDYIRAHYGKCPASVITAALTSLGYDGLTKHVVLGRARRLGLQKPSHHPQPVNKICSHCGNQVN